MLGIAMPQAGRIQSPAVIIDGGCAIDDLVLAVAIDVGDRQTVVALPFVVPMPRDEGGSPAKRLSSSE